jgi:RNA polymerase sigma-70 factor, ECF subfamily
MHMATATQAVNIPVQFVPIEQIGRLLSKFGERTQHTQKIAPATVEKEAFPVQRDASDEELIAAICGGAEWAIEELYQRYQRYAYSLAYRILGESAGAEDIVQEAFFSIWRKAGSYQKQHGSVHSWLQAIVHHRAIDKVRSASHRDQNWVPLQTEGEQDPETEEPEVWEQAWQKEQSSIIRTVMAHLPAEQRRVIELAYFGGYTHAEIAEHDNVPLGTVKGRLRLGLQKMKTMLQQYGISSI